MNVCSLMYFMSWHNNILLVGMCEQFKFEIHQCLVLRPSFVPEKVDINQNMIFP